MAQVMLEIPDEVAALLRQAAAARGVAEGAVAAEAIALFARHERDMEERIAEGRADIAAGRSADHAEVQRWLRSWGTGDALPPPKCG